MSTVALDPKWLWGKSEQAAITVLGKLADVMQVSRSSLNDYLQDVQQDIFQAMYDRKATEEEIKAWRTTRARSPDPKLVAQVIQEWQIGELKLEPHSSTFTEWWPQSGVFPDCKCGACERYWILKQADDQLYDIGDPECNPVDTAVEPSAPSGSPAVNG